MASATRVSNVAIMANGDTLVGPAKVKTVLVVPGSTTSTATLSIASITMFDAGGLTTSGASQCYPHASFMVSGGQTLTATLTGTGTKVYIYFE